MTTNDITAHGNITITQAHLDGTASQEELDALDASLIQGEMTATTGGKTMKLTAINDFHGTECQVPVEEVYENNYGGWVAVVKTGYITWAGKQLCGMADCTCNGPHSLMDENGRVYGITTPSK